MIHQDPSIGTWYWVAGQGPMQLMHIWKGGGLVMRTTTSMAYFASHDQLTEELTTEVWETYKAGERRCGFTVPDDLPSDEPEWADSYRTWEARL